jgi:prepilin-type N-terminal cleavage/methylation domain-containing protein
MIKKFYKKIFKGFSLIEVIIAVNLLALILAILGLSALGSQKLLLNAQIKNEISKIGEGILDYISSLPPSDRFADITSTESPTNNIYSINDFINTGPINNQFILNQINNILQTSLSQIRVGHSNTFNNNNGFTHKGRVILFGTNRNNSSYVEIRRIQDRIYQVNLVILYQSNPRNLNNPKVIRLSRVITF